MRYNKMTHFDERAKMLKELKLLDAMIKKKNGRVQGGGMEGIKLMQTEDYQFFFVHVRSLKSGGFKRHVHKKSNEYILMLKGALKVNDKIYRSGECCTLLKNEHHDLVPQNIDTQFLAVFIPPEKSYS